MPPSTTSSDGKPLQLRQVMVNLLANAIKFTPKGHIALSGTLIARGDGKVKLALAVPLPQRSRSATWLQTAKPVFRTGAWGAGGPNDNLSHRAGVRVAPRLAPGN